MINFDGHSKSAGHAINTQYSRLSGSKQYDKSWEVTEEVVQCIQRIAEQVKPVSSYGTKLSALETLRKIARTILLSGDTLGHEVRKQFQSKYALSEATTTILDSMTGYERESAGYNVSELGKGTLLEKMEWVEA